MATLKPKEERSLYPVLVFIYGKDGYHNGSIRVENREILENMFSTLIREAVEDKREVRITDIGDLMLFHSYNGCIKWNGKDHHECKNCIEM